MRFIADLHIHSRYSRATSSDLTPETLWRWAQYKGINVVGTGDGIHPLWLKELEEKLEPAEPGFYRLKERIAASLRPQVPERCRGEVRFVVSTEIASIYRKHGAVRKVHNLILLSGFGQARALQKELGAVGNITSDGRPILGLDAKELLAISLDCDRRALFIPAHIWTPWFAVMGSRSGFDAVEDCFEELTSEIHALETGLSSDPAMNWRVTGLDRFILVSNSDAHSASKLGREANIFDSDFSYDGIFSALADVADKSLTATIEFFPEEGKYHYDGHAGCQLRWHPDETARHKGLCSVCGKPVTVGVMNRVGALARRPAGQKSPRARPFHRLVPLAEVIAASLNVGPASKKVSALYTGMLTQLGPELGILMHAPVRDIATVGGEKVAAAIGRVRTGEVDILPGYDGEYGTVRLLSTVE